MSKITEAIKRVQAIRDSEADEQVRWYLDKFTDFETDGKSYDECQSAFEADDWQGWGSSDSEDIEIFEGWEGSIAAYDRVLDILQSLAHDLVPAQGQEAVDGA